MPFGPAPVPLSVSLAFFSPSFSAPPQTAHSHSAATRASPGDGCQVPGQISDFCRQGWCWWSQRPPLPHPTPGLRGPHPSLPTFQSGHLGSSHTCPEGAGLPPGEFSEQRGFLVASAQSRVQKFKWQMRRFSWNLGACLSAQGPSPGWDLGHRSCCSPGMWRLWLFGENTAFCPPMGPSPAIQMKGCQGAANLS